MAPPPAAGFLARALGGAPGARLRGAGGGGVLTRGGGCSWWCWSCGVLVVVFASGCGGVRGGGWGWGCGVGVGAWEKQEGGGEEGTGKTHRAKKKTRNNRSYRTKIDSES